MQLYFLFEWDERDEAIRHPNEATLYVDRTLLHQYNFNVSLEAPFE